MKKPQLKSAVAVALELTSPELTDSPAPPVLVPGPPPLESEVSALASCNGQNTQFARDTMTVLTAERLARLRILASASAALIDSDLAAGNALIVSSAQAIADATAVVNDLAAALTIRAGYLRGAAADSAELQDAQTQLAENGLELSGDQIALLNMKVALLPARIDAAQADAAAAVAGIRALIAAGGVDVVALVAELYASTNRIGASFFVSDRVTRTDIEAGYYVLPD
jgi:hypothetical protein